MALYVTDTHPLVWWVTGNHSNLSRRAMRCFEDASSGRVMVYLPAAVLWEIAFLRSLGRTLVRQRGEHWARSLLDQSGFALAPLDLDVIIEAGQLGLHRDPFDAAIVATARVLDLPLITKDQEIVEANLVEVAW